MKKHNLSKVFLVVWLFSSVFISCNSLPWIGKARSWQIPAGEEIAGTFFISSIKAETTGIRNSIESETADLLPLLLLDQRYLVFDRIEEADYIADIKLREREYLNGWKSVFSMGVEIYIYPGKSGKTKQESNLIPLAAAHTYLESSGGFSSSRNLRNLLENAVKEAISVLEKNSDA